MVAQLDSAALLEANALPEGADGVIYPSRLLGTLALRGWIARLPENYRDNRELDWGDTFELLQLVETHWAGTPRAISFGSPVLVLYYRADLFAQVHKHPPQSWEDLHELAELLAPNTSGPESTPPEGARNTRSCNRWPKAGRGAFCWPGRQPTPSIAIITPRCSTSKRWSRWSRVPVSFARSWSWWPTPSWGRAISWKWTRPGAPSVPVWKRGFGARLAGTCRRDG